VRCKAALRQKSGYTKALAEFLGIEHSKIHSVVLFWSECEFKTPMPLNVLGATAPALRVKPKSFSQKKK
jgi:hypothetical protein